MLSRTHVKKPGLHYTFGMPVLGKWRWRHPWLTGQPALPLKNTVLKRWMVCKLTT